MLDVRVYRAAFLPALIALFVVAFSLQGRPSAVRTRAIADAFDANRAFGSVQARDSLLQLGAAFPERRPGGAGDAALGRRVDEVFRAAGFAVSRSDVSGQTVDGEADLETVVGVRPGRSSRRIVVLAHRDALESPGLAELSGTAALLELARIFRTRVPSDEEESADARGARSSSAATCARRSCSSPRRAGPAATPARSPGRATQDAGQIDGVLVLGDLASARWQKPWVVPWSNGRSQPPIGLQRTVEVAARQEVGADPGGSRATAQWARRALPLAVTEQGEVNRAGLPAVLLQISGERGPQRRAAISRERFTQLGRASLRTVIALDEAGRGASGGELRPVFAGEPEGVVTLRNVLPAWSVRLMVLCLLLPALLAALDAFFRARRHRLRSGAWVAWTLAAGLSVPLAWIWLRVLGLAGALPAPRAPVLPSDLPLSSAQAAALASVVLALVGGVAAARLLTRGQRKARGNPAAGAAGAAVGAIVCGDHVRRLGAEPVRGGAAAARRAPVAAARRAADAAPRRARLDRARLRPARAGVRARGGDAGAADRAGGPRAAVARRDRGRPRLGVGGGRARRARGLRRGARPRPARPPPDRRRGAARSARGRAARAATPGRARSAAPNRPCGADAATLAAAALDGPDRRRRAAAGRGRRHAAVGGAGLRRSTRTGSRTGSATSSRGSSARARPAPSGACSRGVPDPRRRLGVAARAFAAPERPRATRSGGSGRRPSGCSAVVVEGTGGGELRTGPGHYPGTRAAGPARHRRRRRPPHDLRRAVPAARRPRARRPDRAGDAVRALHLPRRGPPRRRADGGLGHAPRGVRSAGADRLPSALLRKPSGSWCSRGSRPPRRHDPGFRSRPHGPRSDPCRCTSCDEHSTPIPAAGRTLRTGCPGRRADR